MTLLFNKNIGNVILDLGIRHMCSNPNVSTFETSNIVTSPGPTAAILSGIQPTPQEVITNWNSTYSNNILWKGNINFVINNKITAGSASITGSNSETASGSGTATWALVLNTNIGLASISITSSTAFMILPVSNNAGDGIIQCSPVTLTTGVGFSWTLNWFMAGGSN